MKLTISSNHPSTLFGTLVSAMAFILVISFLYMILQPTVVRSQSSAEDEFIITQEITDEISFSVTAPDVTLSGSIGGLTGGNSSGSTQTVVRTNDPDGYSMTIEFPYATTSGMQANTASTFINNYTPASTGVPDYTYAANATGGAAEFAYSVSASTTSDVDSTFLDNGSDTCGTGVSNTAGACWLNASITPETIISRTSGSAPDGATTTISFYVNVPQDPNPNLDADLYTATATLTATNN